MSEACRGVIAYVALACLRSCLGVIQQATILGHEQKEQAIDQAQELAIVVLAGEFSGSEFFFELGIGRMRQKATPEGIDGLLDASAKVVEGTGASLLGHAGPTLQPAL